MVNTFCGPCSSTSTGLFLIRLFLIRLSTLYLFFLLCFDLYCLDFPVCCFRSSLNTIDALQSSLPLQAANDDFEARWPISPMMAPVSLEDHTLLVFGQNYRLRGCIKKQEMFFGFLLMSFLWRGVLGTQSEGHYQHDKKRERRIVNL